MASHKSRRVWARPWARSHAGASRDRIPHNGRGRIHRLSSTSSILCSPHRWGSTRSGRGFRKRHDRWRPKIASHRYVCSPHRWWS